MAQIKIASSGSWSTLDGNVALLLNGSGLEKGSIFVVFLKKSSDEALNGSASLNGSPPKGSATLMLDNLKFSYIVEVFSYYSWIAGMSHNF